MGNKQISQTELILKFFKQVEDLCLHGHVKRAGRFVADDEFWFDRQCPRDTDPLTLTTGEFMGITAHGIRRHPDVVQQPLNAFDALLAIVANALGNHAFGDYVGYQHARVHRRIRVLKDELDIRAPAPQPLTAEFGKLITFETNAAGGWTDELYDALSRRGLPAAGLADQRQRGAGWNGQ